MPVTGVPIDTGRRLVVYTALAAALSYAERFLPLPVPWMKPGLSNILVLILLLRDGFREAITVAVLKTFLVALAGGGLFSPGHLFSLSGSVAAVSVMGILIRFPLFGVYGISTAGAWSHSLAQLLCGLFLFLSLPAVLAVAPVFLLLSLGTGLLTGYLTVRILPLLEGS